MNQDLEFYQKIAKEARKKVQQEMENINPTIKYSMQRDIKSLRGYCKEVTYFIRKILQEKHDIETEEIVIHKPTDILGHCAVYVPQDDVIIDGTIDQYIKGKFVFEKDKYPLKNYIQKQLY